MNKIRHGSRNTCQTVNLESTIQVKRQMMVQELLTRSFLHLTIDF